MLLRAIFISALVCLLSAVTGFCGPALAVSCSNSSLAATYGRFSKEFDRAGKALTKIEGQFDKLCDYGRKAGTALHERQLKAQLEMATACSGDPIVQAVLLSNQSTFVEYKQDVAGDCQKAEALSRPPQSAVDYVARGKAFAERRDFGRAISDFSEAIRRDSNLASAFYNRAGALNNNGDTKAAVPDVIEAIRLDPKFGGSDYFADGSNDRKMAELFTIANDAVTRSPNAAGGYVLRATMYYFRGDDDLDIRDSTEAIRLNSRDASPLNNRAIAALRKGDADTALDDLNEAILLNPKVPTFFRNRGRVYLQNGDLPHALSDLDEAIRLDPKHQPAFAFRGQVHEKMGQRDRAIADYQTTVFLDESKFYALGLDCYVTAGKRLTALLNDDKGQK
jgi:tetratricopeptide (TPR) repeat protein